MNKRYEIIVFMQGEETEETMEILNQFGALRALNHLKQWHYLNEHETSSELGFGSNDRTFTNGRYIMNWNSGLPYVGLTYDTLFYKICNFLLILLKY